MHKTWGLLSEREREREREEREKDALERWIGGTGRS